MLLPRNGNYNIKYYLASVHTINMILKGLLSHAQSTCALAIYKYIGEKYTFQKTWLEIHSGIP